MSFRIEILPVILMKSEIKLCSMLYNSCIKRGQQHMIFIIQLRDRNDKQTMILACITVNYCRTGISARAIGPKQFS